MSAYGAHAHYNYGKDVEGYANPTPREQLRAQPGDDYFRKGRPGDVLETNENGHLRVIIENTGEGYWVTESTGYPGMCFKYYSFEELERDGKKGGYHVANMDAAFRNTSSGYVGTFDNTKHNLYNSEKYVWAREIRGTGLFFHPSEIARELDLSPELDIPEEDEIILPEVKPGTPSTPVINIFPDNKFSDGLPGMSNGTLGSMEISKSGVRYDILDVNSETYNDYINALEQQGYTMNESGVFTNGTYEVITTLSEDGRSMSVSLKIIS